MNFMHLKNGLREIADNYKIFSIDLWGVVHDGVSLNPRAMEVLDSEEKTAGGIIIPDTAKEKPQEGEVVAVGRGAKTEDGKISPMDVKGGDIVLFGKWSGTEVKIDGTEYSIMKESDIMGISKGKK